MPVRVSVHACLAADVALGAIIGLGVECRHYAERAQQGIAGSYVVSNHITSQAQTTHGQPGDAEDTMDETDLQFSCIASTAAEAIALRSAVRAALVNDTNGILATAKIVVTAPQERMFPQDDIDAYVAQLDLTFYHNPQT